MRKEGNVFFHDDYIGLAWQDENGYWFQYARDYVEKPIHGPISQTLPVRIEPFHSVKTMISFFDGLIPEGWLLHIAAKNWKLNEKDRMELLLAACNDCIGAVSIRADNQVK